MNALVGLASRHGAPAPAARPVRWGRYETAALHFCRFEDFELHNTILRLDLADGPAAWELFAGPPGPLAIAAAASGDPSALREQFDALVADHAYARLGGGLTLELAYARICARRP